MRHISEEHHRRAIRLKSYDYSQAGYYFVTMCVQVRLSLLGEILDGEIKLSTLGHIVKESWLWLSEQYKYVELDEFVVMPNHFHGILIITDYDCRGGSRTAPTGTRKPLGRLIGAFKTVSTKRINKLRNTTGFSFWQRNYYEHIIRNDKELYGIREYIQNNPLNWEMDRENPDSERFGIEQSIYWQGIYNETNVNCIGSDLIYNNSKSNGVQIKVGGIHNG